MSEAIEYRVKTNKVTLCAVVALMSNIAGISLLALFFVTDSEWQIVPAGMGVFFISGALYFTVVTNAMKREGKSRRFLEWKRGEQFSDPPLDEWCESLEDRDAFEVNYEQ